MNHWVSNVFRYLVAVLIGIFLLSCGRSDPIPCTDKCANPGATRCNGVVLQICSESDNRCIQWKNWIDCSYYDQACRESAGTAECSKTCTNSCDTEGDTRCDGTVIQTCALGEKGCLGWVSGTDCSYFDQACRESGGSAECSRTCSDNCDAEGDTRCDGSVIQTCALGVKGCLGWVSVTDCSVLDEICDMTQGQAHCTVVCEDECTVQGSTKCGDTFILTCAINYYGCFYWEYGRDCSESGLICDETGGFATCGPCVKDCSGRQCGPDPVCGESCGTCIGATEVCRLETGQCEDVCAGKDCGTFDGIYCGACLGVTEVCREETGICEDVCLWLECGVAEEIDCGVCPGDEICVTGQCFAPVCSDGMCDVPAGNFWMGCNEDVDIFCDSDEYPYHEVYLDAFEIDMFEVTQAQYFLCVLDSSGHCQLPSWGFDPEVLADYPVVNVTNDLARIYCNWTGKRLCTEAEWEKAARGMDGRRYPWGNEPASCDLAVMKDGGDGCGTGASMPVGSKPLGASPYGALDMAGNVSEWVSDIYSATYYQDCVSECNNPQGPSEWKGPVPEYSIRGGYYQSVSRDIRVSEREAFWGSGYLLGFRCCR